MSHKHSYEVDFNQESPGLQCSALTTVPLEQYPAYTNSDIQPIKIIRLVASGVEICITVVISPII